MLCDNCTAERCADRGKCQVIFCTAHTTKPKPMTNLEKYRKQLATDEGLAEFLMKAHDGEIHIPFCQNKGPCEWDDIEPMGEGCQACMMAYLNGPAEEVNSDERR